MCILCVLWEEFCDQAGRRCAHCKAVVLGCYVTVVGEIVLSGDDVIPR